MFPLSLDSSWIEDFVRDSNKPDQIYYTRTRRELRIHQKYRRWAWFQAEAGGQVQRRTDAGLSIVCRPFDRFGPGKKNPLDRDINEVVGEKET